MFEQQIKNLISNIEKPNTPLQLDVILEGGAFNGGYELGVCYFLKEMEKQNIIKVNRISGASIGSIIGLLYFLDILDNHYESYYKLRDKWSSSLNIKIYKELLQDTIKDVSENTIETLNEKLFISYNNIDTKEQIVKSTYHNKEDLIQTIFKSCHIPYISDDEICYEEFFIDGGMPFIFMDREKEKINQNKDILYVNINYWNIFFDSLNVSKEVSVDGKILTGILECYNLFYKKENNSLCSFTSKWKIQQYMMLRLKQLIVVLLVYFVYILKNFSAYIHPILQNFQIYNKVFNILKFFSQDVLIKCIH